ncbi:MAG TPA: hypothetical protein VLV55_13070 [Rhizomicrobium sp.]|nr:hypothetical protein [Rhizomicrobium sp.]
MGSLLITAIEKIATALLPLILKWIGNEALSFITGRVMAENIQRCAPTAAAEARAEAASPSTEAQLVQSLRDGEF